MLNCLLRLIFPRGGAVFGTKIQKKRANMVG